MHQRVVYAHGTGAFFHHSGREQVMILTASVEHCYCTEGISRSDDFREYGAFESAAS